MERRVDRELGRLHEDLLRMAVEAETAVFRAVSGLLSRDLTLAEDVLRADDRLDRLEVDLDGQCLQLLARFQLEARDLRLIATALKIVSDLERIGDQSVNIAERAVELLKEPSLQPPQELPALADLVQGMLRRSVRAFVHEDAQTAREVCLHDDQADALDDAIVRRLLAMMSEDHHTISRAIQLVLVSRHLERIADHATNIAEGVIYVVEGRTIKHHREDGATIAPFEETL